MTSNTKHNIFQFICWIGFAIANRVFDTPLEYVVILTILMFGMQISSYKQGIDFGEEEANKRYNKFLERWTERFQTEYAKSVED
jgi:hypothetical protein